MKQVPQCTCDRVASKTKTTTTKNDDGVFIKKVPQHSWDRLAQKTKRYI